ncbi:MAG TPA: AI-2E family transporter, partial [Candidatus Omnitrophota bacterium]|nr:AI-2E family transporter [Candidatus Omnitrophota bacterium]
MTSGQRYRFWLIGFAVFIAAVYVLRDMLLPFVAGMAIAYFLDPLADRLQRAGMSRTLATTAITASFFLIVILLVILLFPVIQDQVVGFAQRVPGYIDTLGDRIEPYVRDLQRKLSARDMEKLRSSVGEYAGTAVGWVVDVGKRVLTGSLVVVNILSLLFITPIVTFYLLRDWDMMIRKVDSWLPREHAPTIREQAAEINRTLAGFLRGQATVCLALGAFYGLGLTMVGLDLGLIIGLVAGLISFIPYLGTLSGFVVGVSVAVAQTHDWQLPAMVAAVFVVGQVIEGNFLTPKLVGDRVGLHPVWVMFALLAGATLFGFVGMLLAVPVSASIGVLV